MREEDLMELAQTVVFMELAQTLVGKNAYEIASALIKLEGEAYRRGARDLAEGLGVA